ncbi:MAG: methionyl-tRNA formyltransferase [Bdellovibrionaceae bacterium]|nr:methionyl-tRNA formyltransferase [Pseudobdellovibrionaceae bacterium]
MKYKVLFCGTPEFARIQLSALLSDADYDVTMVVSQPDRPSGRGHKMTPSPVKVLAQEHSIPVLTPEKASDSSFITEISQHTFDICVVVAYGQILRRSFLELFPKKCVNVHASLLPRWRGAAPIQRALMAGDRESGVCLQLVVPKLDAGDIIGEKRLVLSQSMNALELHNELATLSVELLNKDLKQYLKGKITPRVQDEHLVTYAHKIEKDEGHIDWTQPSQEIHNKVRGLFMGPQANTPFQGKRLKILKTEIVEKSGSPGSVLHAENGELIIACGQGSLRLLIVQPESKKPMAISEFLKGYKIDTGDFIV